MNGLLGNLETLQSQWYLCCGPGPSQTYSWDYNSYNRGLKMRMLIPTLEYYTLILVCFLGSYYINLYLKSLYFFSGVFSQLGDLGTVH